MKKKGEYYLLMTNNTVNNYLLDCFFNEKKIEAITDEHSYEHTMSIKLPSVNGYIVYAKNLTDDYDVFKKHLENYKTEINNALDQIKQVKTEIDLPVSYSSTLLTTDYKGGIYFGHSGCCAFVKSTEKQFKIGIPKKIMDLFGYTEEDLQNWLDFISHLRKDFDYTMSFKENLYSDRSFNYLNGKKVVLASGNDFYEIIVNAKKETTDHGKNMLAYFFLICIRYFIDTRYCFIAKKATILKKELGKKIKYREAFLLAHAITDYYQENAFVKSGTSIIPNINTVLINMNLFKDSTILNNVQVTEELKLKKEAIQLYNEGNYEDCFKIVKKFCTDRWGK